MDEGTPEDALRLQLLELEQATARLLVNQWWVQARLAVASALAGQPQKQAEALEDIRTLLETLQQLYPLEERPLQVVADAESQIRQRVGAWLGAPAMRDWFALL